MPSPLRHEDGALLILDQRRLPAEQAWLRCQNPEEVAEAIRSLAVRGAPAIGLAAAYGLALADEEPGRAAAILEETRPTAVNLRWALERGLEAYESGGAAAALEFAQGLERRQRDADRSISELGASHFEPGDRALTHCNTGALATGGTGTAGGVLLAAYADGRLERAWVTETRPLLQGARLTAWELKQAGVPFRIVVDSSVGALMSRGMVDRVVVGADRVAANGDVANKIGTYPIAAVAARHGVPFHVAAPLSTLDPATPTGQEIPIEERDPSEVLGDTAPPGAKALNLAFDVTPAELVTSIFTESGALTPPYEDSIRVALA